MKIYYWVRGIQYGQPALIGSYATEAEARNYGLQKFGGAFEVIPLGTRNMATATQALKARRFDETGNLIESLRRVKHKV